MGGGACRRLLSRWVGVVILLAVSMPSIAGVFRDEVDRFSGSRAVTWRAVPSEPGSFGLSVAAFIPKGWEAPLDYTVTLTTWSSRWQFLQCNHTYWLVDGDPYPAMETAYENDMGSSATIERFTARLERSELVKLASAEKIEFKVCNVEGEVSRAGIEGMRQVLEATTE